MSECFDVHKKAWSERCMCTQGKKVITCTVFRNRVRWVELRIEKQISRILSRCEQFYHTLYRNCVLCKGHCTMLAGTDGNEVQRHSITVIQSVAMF